MVNEIRSETMAKALVLWQATLAPNAQLTASLAAIWKELLESARISDEDLAWAAPEIAKTLAFFPKPYQVIDAVRNRCKPLTEEQKEEMRR
jgi:hypothetical protein